jgi:hypothetical protein
MPNLATTMPDVLPQDNVVRSYVHRDKMIAPGEILTLKGVALKWYDIALAETPVPDDVRKAARAFLARESQNAGFLMNGGLGHSILHRCGADFYFLLVGTWRNENELWKSTYYLDQSKQQTDFAEFIFETAHIGTFCVWELGAVWHEQQAWRRYLRSARDDAAKKIYLADSYIGPV